MTYNGIGSESEATILKSEEERRKKKERERDVRDDNSFARELPVLKAGCTIYS